MFAKVRVASSSRAMRCEALGRVAMIARLAPCRENPAWPKVKCGLPHLSLHSSIATMAPRMMLTGLIALLCGGAATQEKESGRRKLPLSSLSQPAYEPTKQPTSGGRCSDDSSWRYDGGDKGELGV